MFGENWIKLLAIGSLGFLMGALVGRQADIKVEHEQPIQIDEPVQATNALTLYRGNAEATDIETRMAISLPTAQNQTDQQHTAELEQLSKLMSQLEFCGLPIELVAIEEDTATLNLAEHPWQQDSTTPTELPGCAGASWRSGYFQGSAGGLITTKILTHTLLQPDASGEWIDSITFQYEGQPIAADDWDHLTLSGVISRDRLP
jgi:hypothetical protein